MKFFIFFSILGLSQVTASSSLGQEVTISGKDMLLQNIFKEITRQTGYVFFYDASVLKKAKPVTINLKKVPVEEALNEALRNQPLSWTAENKTVTIIDKKTDQLRSFFDRLLPPALEVSGRVTDESGRSLDGVSVVIKGTKKGTSTDAEGFYTLSSDDGNAVLIFSMVGYASQEVAIKERSEINIVLKLSLIKQDEIIIANTGYQSIPKERATGSFVVIDENSISKKLQTSLVSRLEGLIPGMTQYKNEVRIRGTSTLRGNSTPLYVVDGFPYEGSLSALNPWEIESVTILKDAPAASIYGARSANGVIVITTKGGNSQKTVMEYNTSLNVNPLVDQRKYLNLMNSGELVDWQVEMFNYYHTPYQNLDPKVPLNEVKALLYEHEAGKISTSELNDGLDYYRGIENRKELIDNFIRPRSIESNHNLSLRGGSDRYLYSASVNYNLSNPFLKHQKNEYIGYRFKSTYKFYNWFTADVGLIGRLMNNSNPSGFNATSYLYGSRPSYQSLFDNNGNPIKWYRTKSQSEMDRLISLGLYDESYYPLDELERSRTDSKNDYTNLNLSLNFNITRALSLNVKYQFEKTFSNSKNFRDKDSYTQRTTINNATKINHNTGEKTLLIPEGGYISDRRGEISSYTLRAQLNFEKTYKSLHQLSAIAGGERRARRDMFSFVEKWGYDDVSLANKYINEVVLNTVQSGTESLNGTYVHYAGTWPATFGDAENRFVSFYGNASYGYDKRYVLSGSIRMDQSNLFGTDPRYQYKPLWSIGGKWNISNEDWFVSRAVNNLSLRLTQGINGNIAKESGPYLIVEDYGVTSWTQEYSSRIISPPNSGLRWEKTNQTNLGIDFGLFNHRLNGSIEIYSKNTSDLLGDIKVDPTSGWNNLTLNYAEMYNRGVELGINSTNLIRDNFRWNTSLNFSYIKNKILKLEQADNSIASYITATRTMERLPMKSFHAIRWAGLDENGRPAAFDSEGKVVKSIIDLGMDDVVYMGTAIPPYSAAITNEFGYKNFTFSFMFIYYGGHVMRDIMTPLITNPEAYNVNVNKNIMNYWKNPGDEADPDISPAIIRNGSTLITGLWYAADIHILKGDYIKLRDLTVSYNIPDVIARKIKSGGISLSFQARNLWYHGFNGKGYDTETWDGSSSSPSLSQYITPSYLFGLSAKF